MGIANIKPWPVVQFIHVCSMKPVELEKCEYEYCMRCSSVEKHDDERDLDFILHKR